MFLKTEGLMLFSSCIAFFYRSHIELTVTLLIFLLGCRAQSRLFWFHISLLLPCFLVVKAYNFGLYGARREMWDQSTCQKDVFFFPSSIFHFVWARNQLTPFFMEIQGALLLLYLLPKRLLFCKKSPKPFLYIITITIIILEVD